jgi:hypothetical protein
MLAASMMGQTKHCATTERHGKNKAFPRVSYLHQLTLTNTVMIYQFRGVEIDPNADEFEKWYQRFKSMPGSVIPQTQAEINGILNKYLE